MVEKPKVIWTVCECDARSHQGHCTNRAKLNCAHSFMRGAIRVPCNTHLCNTCARNHHIHSKMEPITRG